MRLHSMCTPSLAPLRDTWYWPTLVDDFDVNIEEVDAPAEAHEYGTKAFRRLLLRKVDCMVRAIEQNWGNVFIYSDIDIQFFAKIENVVLESLEGHDIVFQQDDPEGMICTGFYACVANDRVRNFWQEVKNQLSGRTHECGDQKIVNELLIGRSLFPAAIRSRCARLRNEVAMVGNRSSPALLKLESSINKSQNQFGLSWNYLPSVFMSGGTFTGQSWAPGKPLNIPPGLLMHHSNWTVGLAHKLAQMSQVRDCFEARYLPEWTPISGILPTESPSAEPRLPFAYNWCCGPNCTFRVTSYRAGLHLLVVECQNNQFDEMWIRLVLKGKKSVDFRVLRKDAEELDLLQTFIELPAGATDIALHFDQWRKIKTGDARPLAVILKDIRLWDCAG